MSLYGCPACARKIAFSAKVCPKCGHEVTAEERARARRLAKIGNVIASVGLLLLIGGVIVAISSGGSWLIASAIGFVLLVAARRR